jgi:NAD(P)-dependent dehydrogenase (short-subunit alcohol dehydrogenase family)
MTLKGKRVLISGGSQGFGKAAALAFVREGAHVVLCARDKNLLESTRLELLHIATPGQKIIAVPADVIKVEDLAVLNEIIAAELAGIDVLIANAGVYGPKGPIDALDWDEWSAAIDINLKGTVLQCRLVLPWMRKQGHGKIIILSGGGATKPMPNLSAYAASKAAVVRFAETLAEEVRDNHIDVNTIAPGALNTRLLEEILAAGPEKVGETFYQQAVQQKTNGGAPLEKGAALCVYLASSESDGITGRLISAMWDPWSRLHEYRQLLSQNDVYTLRRVVPADRGLAWEAEHT